MTVEVLLLLATTALALYCTGGNYLMQFVGYPTYGLVGEQEFVPFHVDWGKRLIPVFVVPAFVAAFGTLALVFVRPAAVPLWAAVVALACNVVIIGTTLALEVPRHALLDKDGKSLPVIDALVRDNLVRMLAWTVESLVLLYMVVSVITAT